jgi:hypothetical protein
MGKASPLFQQRQLLHIALATSLMLVAPLRAQDGAKVEIVPNLGHSSSVSSVVFSPDGARFPPHRSQPDQVLKRRRLEPNLSRS